jgi:hypothetical protein
MIEMIETVKSLMINKWSSETTKKTGRNPKSHTSRKIYKIKYYGLKFRQRVG